MSHPLEMQPQIRAAQVARTRVLVTLYRFLEGNPRESGSASEIWALLSGGGGDPISQEIVHAILVLETHNLVQLSSADEDEDEWNLSYRPVELLPETRLSLTPQGHATAEYCILKPEEQMEVLATVEEAFGRQS